MRVIRVGILGAGGMGGAHARQYRKMSDVELTFFDQSIERTEAFSKQWDCVPSVSADDLISACDIVDVCLPTDLHLDYGLKAISAGRAVFMEKPMGRTVEECAQLINAASAAGVPLMPGQVVRYFPEFKEGNRLVKKGTVGEPAAARTRRGGLAPSGMGGWFMDHSRSGGVLLDLAIHDFDWLRWTLGEVKHLYSRSLGVARGSGPDYALTTLTFESGAVAHVESTWMDPSGFRTIFEIAGSSGIIEHDSRNTASLRTHVFVGEGSSRMTKSFNESSMAPLDDPYYLELSGFVEAVQDGTPPPVTGYDGAMAVSIALAAWESAKTGQVVAPAHV
jgi:UDP-N-acetylglucosamine 3-dehydrogenase